MRTRSTLLLVAVLLWPVADAHAVDVIRLKSAVLGEDRTAYVYVPTDYARGNSVYPTLYITDGDAAFDHVCIETEFLARNRRIPPLIVVGIPNTNRTRDLRPPFAQARPGEGGGDQFLDFVEKELIPHVEARYRTAPWRMFAGHSLGGLLSLWTLATRPTLFNAHIAISPAMHHENGVVLQQLEQAFANPWKRSTRLWVSVGNEGQEYAAYFARLEKLLKKKAPGALEWESRAFADEDHGTVVLPSHYYGLKWIFSDWPAELRTAGGPVADPVRHLDAHFARLSKTYGYEIKTPEYLLNDLGYREVMAGNTIRGIEILAENARRYPDSPNAWDSLGEAYESDGQLPKARELFKKALDLATEQNDPLAATFKLHYERAARK